MTKIEKIDTNGLPVYVVDNIDNWNDFIEWLYNLSDKEMSLMMTGNVYHFRTEEERRFFVLGFLKAWDVIDEEYVKKYHGDV